MGTVFSTIATDYSPISPFGRSEDSSLGKHFQDALKSRAKESLKASNNTVSRKKPSQGILRNIPSVSNSDINNLVEIESNGNSAFKAQAPLPNNTDKNTKSSASVNEMAIRSNALELDINENPTDPKTTESSKTLPTLSRADITKQQKIVNNKPFQPESWPTLGMIHTHLSKHKKSPSTLIFARFLPNRNSKTYVEICYSTSENTSETILESSDKLETLISPKEEFKRGDTKEDEIKYFLLIFKACINNLQGQVWWNGFSIVLDSNLKNRLKVSALETQPISQLLFELTGMKELEVHRTLHRVELRGQIEGSPENTFKYIRFRGVAIKNIKVKQLRGNLITVHIPEFVSESIVY